jgi:hypothetical protein
MRKFIQLSAMVALTMLPVARCQEHGAQGGQSVPPPTPTAPDSTKSSSGQAAPGTQTPPPQEISLAAAARKAREQKNATRPVKVFTNDNIPTAGGISSVGSTASSSTGSASDASSPSGKSEKEWRDKFAKLRQTLETDQQALNVMQRELGVLDVQYYNDPVKAMQQQLSREDINKKTADIDAKQKQVAADQQAIDDAEDDLRKAGGDPGWAR